MIGKLVFGLLMNPIVTESDWLVNVADSSCFGVFFRVDRFESNFEDGIFSRFEAGWFGAECVY